MDSDFPQKIVDRFVNHGDAVCALDASGDAPYSSITYRQLFLRAAQLSQQLQARGVDRDGWCACDMENCPAYLYLLTAALLGGFTVVALNARLTQVEKDERLAEVRRVERLDNLLVLSERDVLDNLTSTDDAEASGEGDRDARLAHVIRSSAGRFDGKVRAVVMFTSGTSGRPKAAALSWENLMGAARASNASLNTQGQGLWQLSLPMYHVGGLEIVVRSVLNGNPFILYRKFNAEQVLRDADVYGATHASVVDKTLRDLLDADTGDNKILPRYECLLLGGAAPNKTVLQRAVEAGAHVRASYGMTETCSQVASGAVTAEFDGLMAPLPGYEIQILSPDQSGLGQLAVKGPGVFGGYLNAQAAFTADGFFLTGDSARMKGRHVAIAERTDDMFVSGGENIYPEEIRGKLLQAADVSDAYVFGVEDAQWGHRPIAFVEVTKDAAKRGYNAQELAEQVRMSLSARVAAIYMPQHIVAIPQFPRTGIGKTDRATLQLFYTERLQVARVQMWRIKQPLHGMRTAKAHLRERESLIVRITDTFGRTGIGEDVAFSTDWYLPETIEDDIPFIQQVLAPLLLKHVFMHPKQVSALFTRQPQSAEHPLACAAMENAMWDLYGKVMQSSMVRMIGGRANVTEPGAVRPVAPGCVPGGAVISTGSVSEVTAAVDRAVKSGYSRVKLKVKPGHDIKQVRAVRQAHPRLTIMLDANQSYRDEDLPALRQLDALNIACIEEPLDPSHVPSVGPQDLFARLTRLQEELSMPICLDESWVTAQQLVDVLEGHPQLRCVAMKLGKFGGLQPALEFYEYARRRGIMMWVGGMYDTGVSKRMHAAFSTLPGFNLPGDISDTSRYFDSDITVPPFALDEGVLRVNAQGCEAGVGCSLDDAVVERLAVQTWVWE